jgi:hypothetical protein
MGVFAPARDYADLARLGGVSRAQRTAPRLKLMPYKGWVPEDADLPTIRAFLNGAQRQHQMAICDDPRPAVAVLGRAPPRTDRHALPPNLRAWWSSSGLYRWARYTRQRRLRTRGALRCGGQAVSLGGRA